MRSKSIALASPALGRGGGGAAQGHQSYSSLICKWFGIKSSGRVSTIALPQGAAPSLGQIILIAGPSGSGKSTLLRRYRRRCKMPIINIQRIGLSGRAVIDQFGHVSIESALAHLSRVGLAEAHCYLLPPGRLSDGQRWRLRIAMALSRESDRRCCLICDEFASLLDSITAAVVARVLRRAVSASPKLCAIVASSRGDIANALSADVIIRCDFGKVEVWKKAKGGGYVHAGEISRAPGLCARAVDFAGRDAG